jgi:hypothetical protein
MSIEWGAPLPASAMTFDILDNTGVPPREVLQSGVPFQVAVHWEVPAPVVPLINGTDSFRLRAYAESIGPGPEVQLGELVVPGATMKFTPYNATMTVTPNPLVGEGGIFNGVPVSGVYNIVCVLQHLSAGVPTTISGTSDYEKTVMFKLP